MDSHSVQPCQQSNFDDIKDVEYNVCNLINYYKKHTDNISDDLKDLLNNIVSEVETLSYNVNELYDGRQELRNCIEDIEDSYYLEKELEKANDKIKELESTIEKLYKKINPKALLIDLYLELQAL